MFLKVKQYIHTIHIISDKFKFYVLCTSTYQIHVSNKMYKTRKAFSMLYYILLPIKMNCLVVLLFVVFTTILPGGPGGPKKLN